MTWRHWVFCAFLFFNMVSMYGAGINRAKQDIKVFDTAYIKMLEKHKYASQLVIDRLLIELDREPIFDTRAQTDAKVKKAYENEIFNKENWLDG